MDFNAWKKEALLLAIIIIAVLAWRSFKPGPEKGAEEVLSTSLVPSAQSLNYFADFFAANSKTTIFYYGKEAQSEAVYLQNWLKEEGLSLQAKEISAGQEPLNRIALKISEESKFGEEGYSLVIEPKGIEITAAKGNGLFYGIQSLRQLKSKEHKWAGLTIQDSPAFPWRGMLLDCCRHFMEPEFVKRYIDLLAYHKMNVLHWHLTEDQGWRIEIDAYPKLTEVGAWRTEADGSRYGGFYSKAQIREIVEYAAQRHVTVVPEIEMPGHSQAALAAYPELSCSGGPFEVWNDWGVSKEVYCVGNENTFAFLETVLNEVFELFPSKYIHIGGDEAPISRWEACAKCKARVVNRDLHDIHSLQPYMLSRINDFLQANNKVMIGWDEIADLALPENSIVQSWRGFEGAEKAVEAGHPAIVSPTSHAYFDYDLDAINLQRVFEFNPIPKNCSDPSLILGGECNMWSEHAPQETVDSKVFPRILAMAEVLWKGHGGEWDQFQTNLKDHYLRLDELGVDYGAEDIPFRFKSSASTEGWVDLEFEPTSDDLTIYFGRGNYDPDTNDIAFETGAHLSFLDGRHTISARAFRNGKPYGSTLKQDFSVSKTSGREVNLLEQAHDAYPGAGANTLTDGRLGSLKFRDGNWQGWWGPDLSASIDLGKIQNIDSVACGFYQYSNSWIFLPTAMRVYGGLDKNELKLLASRKKTGNPTQRGQFREDVLCTFVEQELRYLRIEANTLGKVPEWHEAAGAQTWLFADEITAR